MIESVVFKTASEIFGVSMNQINENSSMETIKEWDSLNHMNLMMALEEEFSIQFDNDEVMKLTSIPAILTSLKRRNL
jgi:acyl carrier protein